MKQMYARLVVALVVALFLVGAPAAVAEGDPFPGVALGAEVGPHQLVSSSTGNPLDGSSPITCSEGAGLSSVSNGTTHENYLVCVKTWRPADAVNADATFQQAQRDAIAAAEVESQAWNTAHPGLQKCIQWGPILHANGVSTASGGVCANVVPAPPGSVSDSSTVGSGSGNVVETSTPVLTPPAPAPVNTNGFGGYAVVHPDGHVCGVTVSNSSDPFNNGGVMPVEFMGCPAGSRLVFQSAPSADGNVAGWHGAEVVLSGNTYSLPGGSTLSDGIVTDPNGRTWNSGTGAVISPGAIDTRTVLSDTRTVLSETATASVDSATVANATSEVTIGEGSGASIAAKVVSGKTRISIFSDLADTKLSIVASKKGSKKKYTFRLMTNSDGEMVIKSNINLKGFTLVVYLGSEELDREIV